MPLETPVTLEELKLIDLLKNKLHVPEDRNSLCIECTEEELCQNCYKKREIEKGVGWTVEELSQKKVKELKRICGQLGLKVKQKKKKQLVQDILLAPDMDSIENVEKSVDIFLENHELIHHQSTLSTNRIFLQLIMQIKPFF